MNIIADIEYECNKFGNLRNIIIPRNIILDLGKCFIEFDSTDVATKVFEHFRQLKFDGKPFVIEYLDENSYYTKFKK